MLDPQTWFMGTALLSGAIEGGKWLAGAAASGLVGNSFHAAVLRAVPDIQKWYRGEGQPANHHIQRALRKAYLGATRQLLESARSEVAPASRRRIDEDSSAWCKQALYWVKAQAKLLKDERYKPPNPPGPWEPAHVMEPKTLDGEAAVTSLRNLLTGMLLEEWKEGGLRTPPEPVTDALTRGWTQVNAAASGERIHWFELISLYFAQEIKTVPQVQTIFQAETLAKILIELRAFREESAELRSRGTQRPFFAPTAPAYFLGREQELNTLRRLLADDGAVVPLLGMPGLGKTSLANVFAHRQQNDFDGVFWINCAGQLLSACAVELASQLGVRPEGEPQSQLREIRHLCAERHYLLVLDNVESNEIRDLIPGGRCAVLITTRRAGLAFLASYPAPELNLFTPEECLASFRRYLPEGEVSANEAAFLQLGEQLGRLPLGISVAAGLLQKKDPRYTLPRLLTQLKPNKLAHGELDISALLSAAIASATQDARRLLSAMAVCAPSHFRLALALEVAEMEEETGFDALDDLRSRSLVELYDREKLHFRLHSLIRAEVGGDATLEQRHAEAVARQFERWEESWEECEEDLDDWRLALTWAAHRVSSATERTELLSALAFTGFFFAFRRGLLADGLRAMKAVESACEELGDRAGLQYSYGNQAVILHNWGKLEEAMALHKKEEAICLELGNRAGLQASYGNQALILQAWGKLEEAMALHKKQEAICLELGDRAGLQCGYGNQAVILRHWGKLEEAVALHKKQEAICLELGDRAGLQRGYGNQALILQAWGKLEDAMALHKKEEAICLELGDRAGLQRSFGGQALILQDWGKLEDAMALHKKEEAICLELGDRAGLQASYGNQALILRAWGKLEEAMALHKKKEAICLELGDRAGLQVSYGNQGLILRAWGKLEEAMALFKKQEAICLELGDRAGLQASYGNQALILRAWGKLEEAMALFKKQEAICLELGLRASLGISLRNQSILLAAWGQHDEAARLWQEAEGIEVAMRQSHATTA